jgi:hypothetical protein
MFELNILLIRIGVSFCVMLSQCTVLVVPFAEGALVAVSVVSRHQSALCVLTPRKLQALKSAIMATSMC